MRYQLAGPVAIALMAVLSPTPGRAADDENARLREMLHRTQEALRQAQSDNADMSRAKLDAEHKLQDTSKQLDGLKSSSKAAQSGKASLQAQLDAAHSAQTAVQHNLDEANNQLAASNARLGEASRQLAARGVELKDAKQSLVQSEAANSSCEAKNLVLYGYARDVLDRYRKKGIWASLSQKEPVFGLKEVEVENVLQEYQLKFDSQKVKP